MPTRFPSEAANADFIGEAPDDQRKQDRPMPQRPPTDAADGADGRRPQRAEAKPRPDKDPKEG
jgi:hypothetical protein